MGIETIIGVGFGLAGTAAKAYGAYKQGKAQEAQIEAQNRANAYNADIYDHNARLLEEEAEGVIAEGQKEEKRYRRYVEQFKGSQRASMGASGAVLDVGSTFDVIKDTATLGEEDAMTIRSNAMKQRKQILDQAENQKQQAKLIRMGGQATAPSTALNVGTTLLTGANQMFRNIKF